MSLFQTVETPCPACDVPMTYEVVHSVNADRRPDLREAILDRDFQVQHCPSCAEIFRVAPEFSYLDVERRQYLAVWPASRLTEWVALEQRADEVFKGYYGAGTSLIAEQLGRELRQRTVFGWEAAREKLVAATAGIDDVTLELAKIAIHRWADDLPLDAPTVLRLTSVTPDGAMVFGVFESATEALTEEMTVPRDLIAEVDADSEGWQALRDKLSIGSFVDMQRLTLETAG